MSGNETCMMDPNQIEFIRLDDSQTSKTGPYLHPSTSPA